MVPLFTIFPFSVNFDPNGKMSTPPALIVKDPIVVSLLVSSKVTVVPLGMVTAEFANGTPACQLAALVQFPAGAPIQVPDLINLKLLK